MAVKMDDGTTDTIDFAWLPDSYSGIFQFSFLPKSWLPAAGPSCAIASTRT